MESVYDNWDMFQQYLNLLEQHLGTKSEIVLHDLKKDYGNTIADIRIPVGEAGRGSGWGLGDRSPVWDSEGRKPV